MARASALFFPQFSEFPAYFSYSLSPASELPAYTAEAAGNRPLQSSLQISCEQAPGEEGKSEAMGAGLGWGSPEACSNNSLILLIVMAIYLCAKDNVFDIRGQKPVLTEDT